LLYSDRGTFTDGRILVVGPSTVFTNYISRVLPALGEESVHLRALGELVAGVTAARRDSAEVARLKGDERMVDVLTDLAWQTPPTAPNRFRILHDGQVRTLDNLPAVRRRVRARAEASGTKPNAALPLAVACLLDALGSTVEETGDRTEFQRFVQAWWPALTPTEVLVAHRIPDTACPRSSPTTRIGYSTRQSPRPARIDPVAHSPCGRSTICVPLCATPCARHRATRQSP
jgi:hypothetical protein